MKEKKLISDKNNTTPKIIAILGPTATGKTKLAVKLANYFNGEIISADSRQVYKGMDIGTGKDLNEYTLKKDGHKNNKINHHLIDVAQPNDQFNIVTYNKLAKKAIHSIFKENKIPFIVGGTGLYAQSLIENFQFQNIKPDIKLRNELEKLPISKLLDNLKIIDVKTVNKLNESDKKNKRRLIRLIEINSNKQKIHKDNTKIKYNSLLIGLNPGKEVIHKRIKKRLSDRINNEEMIDEVANLNKSGLSWNKIESFGLEYRFIAQYLQGNLKHDDMIKKLNIAIRQFAKRQLTWLRRWEKQGSKIHWVNNYNEAETLIKQFLKG